MLVDTHRQVGQGRKRHIEDTRVHALAWRTFRLPVAKAMACITARMPPAAAMRLEVSSGVITVSVVSQLDSSYRSMSKHTGIESWESNNNIGSCLRLLLRPHDELLHTHTHTHTHMNAHSKTGSTIGTHSM
jgi:hypothetical protein